MATNIYKLSERLIDGSFTLKALKTLYYNDLIPSKDLEELLDHWTGLEVFMKELPQGEHIDKIIEWLLDNFDHDMWEE